MTSTDLRNAIYETISQRVIAGPKDREDLTDTIMGHVEHAFSQALNIRIREWANAEAGFATAAALDEEPAKAAASQAAAAALNVCRLSLIDLTKHLTNDI